MPDKLCVFIAKKYNNTENSPALDFILAASNIISPSLIKVIFINKGLDSISHFFVLEGFDFRDLYAEEKILGKKNIDSSAYPLLTIHPISREQILNYATHCHQIFCF